MAVDKTIPYYLLENVKKNPKRTAIREKDYGIWIETSWEDYAVRIASMAAYMQELGVKPGNNISIIGDNKPEWVIAELAAQLLGAIAIGIYQDSVTEEVKYLLEASDSVAVVAEDQEQVDKVLDILEEIPRIQKIIYYDDRGMYQYDHDSLIYFDDAVNEQKMGHSEAVRYIEGRIKSLSMSDVAVMCTTSGTTGKPKLAMLTHSNLVSMAENLADADPKYQSDEFVSFLPLPWIGEQMMCVVSALRFGFTVNFPESTDTVQEDMKEIGPNFVFSPPRVWENMASTVQVKIMDATPFKQFMYKKMYPIGEEWANCKFEKREPGFGLKLKYKLAYWTMFRKLKERMGFSHLRSAMTGGAALGPDTFRFFHALGINLKQIYGQTEISGISCIHRNDDIDFTSVGTPIRGTEIKLTDDGEIISKSGAVFAGYYGNKEATEEALVDGWLYSGDAGYFDDEGKLVVIDRMKDLMYLNDGTRFSPQFIENKIKFSPYVKEAVALGDKRDYITLILNIEMGIVGKWAENNKIGYTTYTDLSAKKEVYDLIAEELKGVNAELPPEMQVKKFVLLYKELDADDGELTRTRKVRRGFIEERYKEIVEALYKDLESVHIKATIKLQDGRERSIETDMRLYYMQG
ncbi:AMP-binding protein [Limisalsivibrio acetivorans]|uniref:AMP-binding protein n=1 Tax=Limisalsivibrio acetivorans TaxID=1304888 RepID=UPI0003B69DA8|nr:AMP-binding protein [Limisalsivibrio acetivorans]